MNPPGPDHRPPRAGRGRHGAQRNNEQGAPPHRNQKQRNQQQRNEQQRLGPDRSGGLRQVDAARRVAYDMLVAVSEHGSYANLLLPRLLQQRGITGRDAALATELGYGTLRAQGMLDAVLHRCSDRQQSDVDTRLWLLLRLGCYQLLRTRIPAHAAVATTIALARTALSEGPARFANAVLRRVSENDLQGWQRMLLPDADADRVGYLSLRYSHPSWVVRAFADALGEPLSGPLTETEQALAADDTPSSVHLLAEPGRITVDGLAEQADGTPARYSPYGVYLNGGRPASLPAVRKHLAMVMDEGSQLVAAALAAAGVAGPDVDWLDMCAGPGGKAALLGGLAAERGAWLHALEVAEHRAQLVATATAGLPVSVHTADATSTATVAERTGRQAFDRVLVDAPCSGLGALRRRPEARWRRQPEDLAPLGATQRKLLEAAIALTRAGGVVGYVTCSPQLAETQARVAAAARRAPVQFIDARPLLPGAPGGLGEGPTVQLWPHRHGTDAMFLALLRRE